MPPIKSIAILGTPLSVTTYEELSRFLMERACGPGSFAVDFSNTHVVTMRRHEPSFFKLTSCIDLFCPDGMPLIWAMNAKGSDLRDRVYGPTFTRDFLTSVPARTTHYLVGGSEDCGQRFRARMLERNSSIAFVGGYHGACSEDGILDDDDQVLAEILSLKPDFIWIGLGAPKQYEWLARTKPLLDRGIFLSVGFAFDVNAGTKSDAPMWMQRRGLTWLYRMASEPRRLGRRYVKWNSLFLWYLLGDALARSPNESRGSLTAD